MTSRKFNRFPLCRAASMLVVTLLSAAAAIADEPERGVFVLTSTNDPSTNQLVVFRLDTAGTPALSLVDMLPTQGKGGAGRRRNSAVQGRSRGVGKLWLEKRQPDRAASRLHQYRWNDRPCAQLRESQFGRA